MYKRDKLNIWQVCTKSVCKQSRITDGGGWGGGGAVMSSFKGRGKSSKCAPSHRKNPRPPCVPCALARTWPARLRETMLMPNG